MTGPLTILLAALPGVATALLLSSAIAVPAACGLALLPAALLEAAGLALLAGLIPAAAVAVWPDRLPVSVSRSVLRPLAGIAAAHGWPPLHLVLGALPALLLPLAWTMARLPAGQRRAGSGLGAGPVLMLRLVWLPQLAPPVLLGLLLAFLLDLAALLPYPGRTS